MRQWKVDLGISRESLEERLNYLEQNGWAVHQVSPAVKFEDTKVVMAKVPLPTKLEYDIVCFKLEEEFPDREGGVLHG